jgi:quinone-modifying oxidoreductase, subunit QmoB
MEKKIAAYLCTGCGIGEALDVDALAKVATKDCKAALCRKHPSLCSPEGVQLIRDDMEKEGVNTQLIAACSPRVMFKVFQFDGCVTDRVNLREQVVWSHPGNDEDTQMIAEDNLRMGAAKAKKTELPEPFKPEQEISKGILVVGGGLAGLTAALEVARAGYDAVLVEKQPELGGFQRTVAGIASLPYQDVTPNDIPRLVAAVQDTANIKVYKGASIESVAGAPGLFEVKIKQGEQTHEHRLGAIVVAAGWRPYDPAKLPAKLGYGASPKVITNVGFEQRARNGAKNVAFLQCAGQRDPLHVPYCSSACCVASLKQAIEVKQQHADAKVFVVYKELRTPGHAEDIYRKAQRMGVTFIRCQDPEVHVEGDTVAVRAHDEMLGETLLLEDLDLVVLATGMVPETAFGTGGLAPEAEQLKCSDIAEGTIVSSSILNLQYRQGPELPSLRNGFPDSHFVCFPYESRRTGIFPAGCVRRPMGIANTIEDATGAAMKAIQAVELASRGMAAHPRAGDTSYPLFFMQRCTQCKRCTEECPFGAINEDEKSNPILQPTRCRRCGVCMGACPERIISFANYSVGMIGDMIKSINVPEELDEKPRILVFACENDAYPALDMIGMRRANYNAWIRIIPMRCIGSLNLIFIADALSKGIDGVVLLGCRHGENYECHFVKGSELANTRLSKIKETLDRLSLESDRVLFESVSIADNARIAAVLDKFAQRIQEIGPNPYKG